MKVDPRTKIGLGAPTTPSWEVLPPLPRGKGQGVTLLKKLAGFLTFGVR